jgi:hypothetical protein
MIPMCDDQETTGTRACPGYAGPPAGTGGQLPLLPGRNRPQHPGTALPVRYEPGGVGGHRAGAARPGVETRPGRRPARHRRRDIADGIRYLVKEGIQWRAMPADFPPYQTVCDTMAGWQASGATEATHGELREQCRIAAGRKRHIAVDTTGLLLTVLITAASIQDRDAVR